jgi:two-component system, chemotaxis family, CheB/CheR fusion protein
MELFNQPSGKSTTIGTPLPKLRLVVVDDNQSSSQMLKRILEIGHHQVWVSDTGLEGVELILREKPDLAFVDIGLPDITGYEVAKRVKESTGAPPTFLAAVTGHVLDTDIEQAHLSGFDAHLAKPLDNRKLAEILSVAAARLLEHQSDA